jgi:RHS repeat-associated protein
MAFRYDAQGRLTGATGATGRRTYIWGDSSGLIEQVIDADGVIEVLNEYDADGRVASQRSPFGRVSRYSYLPGGVTEVADTDGERSNTWIADATGRLIGVIDSDGNSQSYVWNTHGDMVESTDRMGQRTVREYDERGRIVRELSPSGADVQYGYDDLDRIVTVVAGSEDGTDAVTSYEYDGEQRNPSVIIDPVGGRTTMVWQRGLLAEVTDPTAVTLRFGYDANGDLVSTTNAVGDTARLERDAAGRVVSAVTPSGRRTDYTYDDAGMLLSRRDPDGAVWRFEHTAAGRLSAQVAPDGGRTEFEHGSDGTAHRTTDPLGRTATRLVDDLGNLSSLRLPDGSTWSYTHDALSRLVETVDPTGGVWRNRYDADGILTATEDPTGVTRNVTADRSRSAVTVDEGLLATTVKLDALGRAQTLETADDDVLTYVYDACGRVVELLDAEGALTLIVRDAAGRPVRVTDPTGISTGYVYDECGRLSQIIAHDGAVTAREYDADSLLVRQSLPNGEIAWAKYDACGRLTQVHQPGSGTATYTYDRCGRVASAVDTWWGTRRFSYDRAGQLISVTNGLGAVTRYEYDENGRVIRTVDPFGGVTEHRWDGMGRLISETDPLGRSTTAGYDPAGRQLWQQSADGSRLTFVYDASGVIESTSVDDEVIAANTYDVAGRSVTIHDRTGADSVTHVKEWDRVGRLVRHSRTFSDGTERSLTWSYDRAGRRTRMVDAFGRATSYRYGSDGRLERIEHPSLGSVTLSHDAAGRLVAAESIDPRGRTTRQAWVWADGFITAHTTTGGGETVETVIERDADGRIASIVRNGAATSYAYDQAEQLIELVADGVRQSWRFDLGGRVVGHSVGAAMESYDYDPAGQLIAEHHGDGTTTSHEYDADGARVRTVRPDGEVTGYRWSGTGWLSTLTSGGLGDGSATTALGTDALGQLTEAGSNTLWWDTAAEVPTLAGVGSIPVLPLGAITGIGDRWITPGWRTTRADSGNPWQVSSIATLPDGFGLTATGTLALQQPAGSLPLEWLGARAYDPATHAFLAKDPLPPVPGAGWAANPYSYAGNNPLAFSDPTGLHPLTDDELRKQTRGWLSKAWDATTHWVGDNWEYLVAGAAIVGGIALMCTGVGGPAGIALMAASGALIAGGADTAIQKATTGKVDWGQVALTATVGAATGGAGAWAAGVASAANGATALAYSAGLNGGIGALGSEATYLITNHSHLSWQGAAGAFVGGGVGGAIGGGAGPAGGTVAREMLGGAAGATTSVAAKVVTTGINAGGGAAGDIVTQVVTSPGQPVNWQHVAVAGGAGGATSLVTSHIPGPAATNSIEQQSYFGTRSWTGISDIANANSRALVGSSLIGGIVGAAEGPGIDKLGG